MDPEEMEEWRTIFNLFDVDGDESITCEVKITYEVKIKYDDSNQGSGGWIDEQFGKLKF